MRLKFYIKYMILIFLIGMLFFLYSFSKHRNQQKKVQKIAVTFKAGKNHFLTHKTIRKMLTQNGEVVENLPKRMIDLHYLEKNVLASSYVEEATVFLTPNGVLKTIVKQREPIARIVNKNTSYYIDKYGAKMPLSTIFSARVPLVSGVNSAEDIKELTKLVALILKDNFLKKEVVGIKKTLKNEYIFNVRSGDYKIKFGKFTKAQIKFKKLKAFYNKALLDKTIQNYKTINIKYHNQVVCTK